jgi:type VI protein secretion system component VasF
MTGLQIVAFVGGLAVLALVIFIWAAIRLERQSSEFNTARMKHHKES